MDDLEQAHGMPGAHEIDYRESMNVTHVHAAIQREKKEPLSAGVPIPFWLMGLFFVIFGWGSYYLGMFSGGYSGDVFDESAGGFRAREKGGAGGGEAAEQPLSVVEQGKKVFKNNCATCHQPTGLGIPGQYPPLAGSEFVNGTPRRLAMILLKGLQGPVTVKGNSFNGAMPTWTTLQDKQIAAVLTYIRQEWGNKGGEIEPGQIAHARKEYKDRVDSWTEADLKAVPADAVLEGAHTAPAAAAAPRPLPALPQRGCRTGAGGNEIMEFSNLRRRGNTFRIKPNYNGYRLYFDTRPRRTSRARP